MIKKENLKIWQERLAAQQPVWAVRIGPLDISENYYATKEAAEEEVAWRERQGAHSQAIVLGYLHDLALARERWGERCLKIKS